MNINNSDYLYSTPTFTATAQQYKSAVGYLRHERRGAKSSLIKSQFNEFKANIKTQSFLDALKALHLKLSYYCFANTDRANEFREDGVKIFDVDKLEGIQYGIDVFKDLTMREIIFLAYRLSNVAVKRGCAENCGHCSQSAVPAHKDELSEMPFEDFKSIADAFDTVKKRINKFLGNKDQSTFLGKLKTNLWGQYNIPFVSFFLDSDGMRVESKDVDGNIHSYTELVDILYKALGDAKHYFFDTKGFNPKNNIFQQRAEEYAQYFSQPDIEYKVEQANLSINTFDRWYLRSYKLGYRPGEPNNDLTKENIKRGKDLYDMYIEKVANMMATLGGTPISKLLMTYAVEKYESNMKGMYLSDLKQILVDVQKRCDEMLKEKYPAEEYKQKIKQINSLINDSIEREERKAKMHERCCYIGRYKDLYARMNPDDKRAESVYCEKIEDLNKLSIEEYWDFVKRYEATVDANGDIYYTLRTIVTRKLGDKSLNISTKGMKTPKMPNLAQ